jgi:repressor LexA
MSILLTERQHQVLEFISTFQSEKGIPPSTREIQRHFKFASQTAVMGHLGSLANKGMIEQLAGRVWGLKTKEIQTHLFDLPVYGTIPAGIPAMQDQEPIEVVPFNTAILGINSPKPYQMWGLKVSGDSMIDAHILDGDLAILVRREPRPGEIIAALVDGTSTTLKQLIEVKGRAILRAANKKYKDIVPEETLEAQGVVIGVIRRIAR